MSVLDTYECTDKYFCTTDTLRETLGKYGVAILPSVLNEEECDKMKSEIWDFFEHISQTWEIPIKRDDTTTWKQIYSLIPSHAMLFQWYKVGHCQAAWNVRQNPKVVEPYSKLYGCTPDKLLTSFDGLSFGLQPEITNRGWFRKTWFHTDQSFTRNEWECTQSWVTAEDVECGDATLAFLEKSHLLHSEFAKEFDKKEKDDWYQLKNVDEQEYYKTRCPEKRITCPKGSMVFWDSRTIHCGTEAVKGRTKPKNRSIIYTCFQPRTFATAKLIEKKRKAFKDSRTTSHWPAKPKLFSKLPQHYGNGLPEITSISEPVLSDLGRKLAGF
jgi:hypothetical protein